MDARSTTDAKTETAYRSAPTSVVIAPSKLALAHHRFRDAPPGIAIRMILGLRRLLIALADRLTPAQVVAFEHATAIASTALLGAITRFDIPDLLEEKGPLDAKQIAKARGLNADAVHRTLRAMSSYGFFTMHDDGRFENNRLSRALRSGEVSRAREWALYFSSGSNSAAWLDYAGTLVTGESAFTRVHGRTVWEWFEAHEGEREMFAHCMMGLTIMVAPVIATRYPFAEVKRVCDVGGGRGTLLSEILVRNKNVEGVLCDAPGVIDSARELLTARGVLERAELIPGNFFEKIPENCDAYLLKNILHDWDDETSRKILRTTRAAAKKDARVIVCEQIVDHASRDFVGTRADLQMMIACDGGRERSEAEIHALLKATGFRPMRSFHYPLVSMIEGIAE